MKGRVRAAGAEFITRLHPEGSVLMNMLGSTLLASVPVHGEARRGEGDPRLGHLASGGWHRCAALRWADGYPDPVAARASLAQSVNQWSSRDEALLSRVTSH